MGWAHWGVSCPSWHGGIEAAYSAEWQRSTQAVTLLTFAAIVAAVALANIISAVVLSRLGFWGDDEG